MTFPLRLLVRRLYWGSSPAPQCRRKRTLPTLEVLEGRLAPATAVWDGSADGSGVPFQNANWSSPQNWIGDVAPSRGDDLVFPIAAFQSISNDDFAPGTVFHSISIAGSGYQLTGNAVQLQAGLTTTNASGLNTVGLPLTLTGPETFTSTNAGANLILSAPLDNGGSAWAVGGAGDVQFSGSSIRGAGGLTKFGTGQLYLSDTAANTYAGTTTINAGTVFADSLGGNSVPGNLVIGNAGGSPAAAVLRLALANQVSDAANVTIGPAGLLDLNGFDDTVGPITLTAGRVATGTGTLTLNGDVTSLAASAPSAINGHLALGGGSTARAFTVGLGTAGGDLSVNAVVAGSAGVSLVKQGAGRLSLSGSNTYAGLTVVSAGTLRISNANSLGATSAGTTVNSGASLDFVNLYANSSDTFAAEPLTLSGGGDANLPGGGALHASGTSAMLVLAGQITLAAHTTLTEDSGTTLDLTGLVTGPGGFTKTGAGQVSLGQANSFAGAATVNQGVLALDDPNALGPGSGPGVTVTGQGTLQLEGGLTYAPVALTVKGTGSGGSRGGLSALHSVGSNTWTGPITLAADSQFNVTDAGTLALRGVISGPATSTLTIGRSIAGWDDGTVSLHAANTYAGPTVVDVGTLVAANATALGSPTGVANTGTTVNAGATLELRGSLAFDPTESLTIYGSGYNGEGALFDGGGSDTWAGSIYLAASAAVGANAGKTLSITGVIGGPTGIVLSTVGSGTVALAAANSYQGGTTVTGGTLALQNAAALGWTGAGTTVWAGATLELEDGLTYNAETINLYGTGVGGTAGALRSLTGSNTWTGLIKLGSDATIESDFGSTLDITGQVTNRSYRLTVDANGNAEFDNTVSGAGGVTKDGTGTLTFGGNVPNLYAGATVVNAGTLWLTKPAGIEAVGGAGLTINAGATLAGAGSINTNVTNAGLVSPGGTGVVGTLVINGNYTQTAGGMLDDEITASSLFDQLAISGLATLGGTLNVGLLNGFWPLPGQLYSVLTFGSSAGYFAAINLPPPANGVPLVTAYDTTDLTVET
jgi:autotransporter-associated beta strand protein